MFFGLLIAFGVIYALGQILEGYDPFWCIIGILVFTGGYNESIQMFGIFPTIGQAVGALAITYGVGHFFFEKRFDGTWTVIGFMVFSSMLAPTVSVVT